MMIDKRLVNSVPDAKKFVALTVIFRTLALLANTAIIFSVAGILGSKGTEWKTETIIIAFSLCIKLICDFLSSLTGFKSSSSVKKTLRSLIYKKLLQLGPAYQEQNATAKIVQLAVEGVEQLETWFSAFLPQFFYSIIAAVVTFVILSFLNLPMALVLFCCIPLIPIAMMTVQSIAKKLLGKYWSQYANLADNFLENLQGLTTLQIYQADEYKAKKMHEESETFRKITMKVLSMQLNSIIIMDIVAYGGAALGITAALLAFYSGSLTLQNAFICILLSADFFIPLRTLGSAFHTAMNGSTASKNIFELLDMPSQKKGTMNLPSYKEGTPIYQTQNLSYNFDRTVLNNINITIQKGSFTAFVGKSGSGKSTVAKVLSGIYSKYAGSVKLNGLELKEINPDDLYEHTTYISHRDWIFAGNVRECLLEGSPAAKDDLLWKALEDVQLADFIMEQDGLETQLLEGGTNLSGGQRQRLSIARALLRNSEVYIFDEATSNIDVESEEAILALLKSLKGKKTIIMISHRKENCKDADTIYTFENGNLINSTPKAMEESK